MAGRIPQPFIQDLVARTNIIDIIQARVHLKKRGQTYMACCPFHDEKTPSFTVSESKQFYHCFGCGQNGNAISFLMEYDRMEFVAAVEYLAAQLGVEVPREAGHQNNQQNIAPLYELMLEAAKYYVQQLKKTTEAIDYLKNRGLSGQIAKRYGIGFAPSEWRNLESQLGSHPTLDENLIKVGLYIDRQPRPYDRFRNRVMFPIRDVRGRTIGFGGRTMGDEQPKYLNSPETPIFHKSNELYGLYECRQQCRHIERILVVEGYMDVIALAQFDIPYAVATLGTAINPKHLQKLLRYCTNVVYCFDGDAAGRRAAWKALTISMPQLRDGINIHFLFLPDGEDPDSLVQKEGREAFEQRIVQSASLADVLFTELERDIDINSIEGKAEYSKKALELIRAMPNGIYQQLLIEQVGSKLGVSTEDLTKALPSQTTHQEPIKPSKEQFTPQTALVENAIYLLLQEPALALKVSASAMSALRMQHTKLLWQLLRVLQEQPNLPVGQILSYFSDAGLQQYIAQLAARELPVSLTEPEAEFFGAIERIQEQTKRIQISQLIEKSRENIISNEERQMLARLLKEKEVSHAD